MPVLNRAVETQAEIAAWRRKLHQNPELLYDVHETAQFVEDKLKSFGCDLVETGVGRTGVVGIIKGRHGDGPAIGLRADMDALPITETSGVEWVSQNPGKAHSCGHDGHTSMLLGAAQYLAETRNFRGSVALLFQPAEEGGAGGLAMVEDGVMDRFNISEVYGIHNMPGLPVGQFAMRKGPIMAATDEFDLFITGRGGHAAQPHRTIDPILAGSQLMIALQGIVSRNVDPLDSLVISVTKFIAGEAYNVIPEKATLSGTVRTLKKETRAFAERRIREAAAGIAAATGAEITVRYKNNYPVTYNHDAQTEFAARVASAVAGEGKVDESVEPMMAAEDFSYMLEARPGAYIFLGNGDTPGLHHPAYDFNDDAIPYGVSYFVAVAETALAA
ncbi:MULTISPECIES: M20 aminoacylase family protein [Brucella]|uniref:Amidohydrolase n=1 Tax=Brucella anthropi (strain ATCC 49188 / DSM 6882 / CCUG 24695 / JCM 21032 / LMG 3331 / NBRC 15819 / NCTC 12168 / Alc 37) TaxID=439375 RepID=A6WXB8_BRUA4|nr:MULTISPECIES: M20 aminoacylase family protein [Brucella]ABS13622.1 amidohydrolase [Brucella anthropi ATCC 49188]AIK44290.1 amidohydrolase family protein [Brucella anthropi]KAB2736896.1 amidohydrolase [Brucella anthropi]KAB2751018.1 amidohydrolase [Brucella anthropi]KAB2779044.1 amidohydrolase [Brucella anthropi]